MILTLLACGPVSHFTLPEHSPRLETQIFSTAVRDLNRALGCNFVTWSEGTKSINVKWEDPANSRSTLHHEHAWGEWREDLSGRFMILPKNTGFYVEVIERICLHEIGHALGLDHVKDPGAIMYGGISEVYSLSNSQLHQFTDALSDVGVKCKLTNSINHGE